MNKSQLVDALAARMGDRRAAATAVDGLLDIIVATVGSGSSVSLTGFGVFEARARAARVARNPRTGATVDVPPTTVPAFRPGTAFRSSVGGNGLAPATGSAAPTGTAHATAPEATPEIRPAEKAVAKAGSKKSSGKAASGKAASGKAASGKAASGKAASGKSGSGKTGSGKTAPADAATAGPGGKVAGGKARAKSPDKKAGRKTKVKAKSQPVGA